MVLRFLTKWDQGDQEGLLACLFFPFIPGGLSGVNALPAIQRKQASQLFLSTRRAICCYEV